MRRPSGFPNEVLLSWDQDELLASAPAPEASALELTDIGFFPHAEGHFRTRHSGCPQHVVLVCLEGRGFLRIAGKKEQILTAGDVGFIPRGSGHEYGASSEYPWTIQWVHFRGGTLSSLQGPAKLPEPIFQRARDLFADILTLASRDAGTSTVLHGLAWWLELVLTRPSIVPPGGEGGSPIAAAIRKMAEHLAEPLTLETIAEWAALSPSWFSTVFRQEVGASPMAHLARLRVQRACALLERTDLPVAEVARQVGFSDPLHFSRVFHKKTGLSPSQWRVNPRG